MLDKFFSKIEKFVPERWRWVLNHDGFKRYFANTGWMFGGQIFSLVVAFFIGAWLARYLGPENYGLVNYAVAFVGLFGFLAGLGTDIVINRDLVKNPGEENKLMGTGFTLRLMGSILAFVSVMIANHFVAADRLTHCLIFLYGLSFFLSPFNIVSIYFQAKVQAKNGVRAQLLALAVSSGLKIIFVFSGWSIIWLIMIYVLDSLWLAIGLWLAYWRSGRSASAWAFDKAIAKRLWRDSWPLMLSTAAAYIYLKVDQVMIGRLLGTTEVGLYAAAVKLAEVWYFIPAVICASLFPAIINAKKTDESLYHRRLHNLYVLMVAIAAVIALPIFFLAKPVIIWLFGQSYLLSVPILQIYIWSGVGFFFGAAISQRLVAENKSSLIFLSNLAAMVVNIGLNFWLISFIGLTGAAWSTLISYLVMPAVALGSLGLFSQRSN